jgi:hypothetical protein
MVSGSQSKDTLCVSPSGSHRGVCQVGFGSQVADSQGGSIAGSPCCLAGESQAMTWDDNGALVPSPPPTGLVDWTSLHRGELSNRVIQNMGMYYQYCDLLCQY